MRYSIGLFCLYCLFTACSAEPAITADTADVTVTKWQKTSLDFTGPNSSESADRNPFTSYRLDVNFFHGDSVFTLPGYYAADGRAAETSADSGNVWRVNFRPNRTGAWRWEAVFRRGEDIVYEESQLSGERLDVGNQNGTIWVRPAAEGERGRLLRKHPRYLKWAESGDYFLKGGADSPENFLAYKDFDGTYRHSENFRDGESKTEGLHHYSAHEGDWQPGDPTWQNGKGKGIIGALNYLASTGMNSFYFLTMNINGDGKDVFPFVRHDDFTRFDCSRLDQWEVVFDHADDNLGLMLHAVLQETENETLFDGGDTGPQRKLFLRELIARFGHHRALTWNMGEENGPNNWSKDYGYQTNAQQAALAKWLAANDPYRNYIALHTHPNAKEAREILDPLLGNDDLGGLALQIHRPAFCHEETLHWIEASQAAGAPWIATVDEIGPWFRGLDPDDRSPLNNQDSVRALTLWGNLMAGGAGVEWYFGARSPHNDLNMEDWRSRDRAFRWTGATLKFFHENVPFATMKSHDELVDGKAYCLAKPGSDYLVYFPFGQAATLSLGDQGGDYFLRWFNPVTGQTTKGSVVTIDNPTLLTPPFKGDAAALLQIVKKINK